MTQEQKQYINRLQSTAKAKYAKAYMQHLDKGGNEPERPKGLSYMAAQAVRLALHEMQVPQCYRCKGRHASDYDCETENTKKVRAQVEQEKQTFEALKERFCKCSWCAMRLQRTLRDHNVPYRVLKGPCGKAIYSDTYQVAIIEREAA